MASQTGASFAALQTQVKGLETDYSDLKNTVLNLDRKIDSVFNSLATKLDASSKTPWTVIWAGMGVMITVIGLIGALAYAPINTGLSDVKQVSLKNVDILRDLIVALPDKFVSHSQRAETMTQVHANTTKIAAIVEDMSHNYVGWREHERLNKQIDADNARFRTDLVTREEHKEHWRAIDIQIAEVQKQVEEIKRAASSTWGLRDEMQRLQREIDRLQAKQGALPS